MTRPWRFTRTAETSLTGIADWTFGNFGARQAAAYEEDLIGVCRAIADGAAMSRDCRRIIARDLPDALCFARAAEHFNISIEDKDEAKAACSSDGPGRQLRQLGPAPIARERGSGNLNRVVRFLPAVFEHRSG